MSQLGKSRSNTWLIVTLLLLAVAIAGILVASQWHNKVFSGAEPISASIQLSCADDQVRCAANLGSLGLEMHPFPAHFPALEDLGFVYSITLDGEPAADLGFIKAELAGRDMFMGTHALRLEKNQGNGELILSGIVPVCVTGPDMVWRATLTFELEGARYEAYADLRSLPTG